jgi:hypothetical protein
MHCALRRGWLALAIPLVFTACDDDDVLGPGTAGEGFRASLTGAAERPNPVTTTATGEFNARFLFADDANIANDAIRFELFVFGLTNVIEAHIHAGDANTAGPIMVFLFGRATPPIAGPVSGVLRQADIFRTSTFASPFTFDSVVTRMRNGTAYVNVHTTQNPAGEIRGQIASSNELFPF